MKYNVAILDYGSGNLKSVYQAFIHLNACVDVYSDMSFVNGFTHVVLPGVGSFRRAMGLIKSTGVDKFLNKCVSDGVPILGICLGMQLLASRSSEDGETEGLGLISANVDRFSFECGEVPLKIPHVGFDSVSPLNDSKLFKGLGDQIDFYFTHSYRLQCSSLSDIAAEAFYGESFVAAVEQGSIAGTQFHPEKSQANGLRVLQNFLDNF